MQHYYLPHNLILKGWEELQMSRRIIRTCVVIWGDTVDYTVKLYAVLCFYRWHDMQHHWLQYTDRLHGLVRLYVLHYTVALSPYSTISSHLCTLLSSSIHSCIYHSIHLLDSPTVSALHCTARLMSFCVVFVRFPSEAGRLLYLYPVV